MEKYLYLLITFLAQKGNSRGFITVLLFTFSISLAQGQFFNALVSNGNNSGSGSLRQAIIDINNSGQFGTIMFGTAITVSLSSPLPAITVASCQISLGSSTVFINGNGIPGPVFTGNYTFNATPSYAYAINFANTTYTVTNTNTFGTGSLTQALEYCEQTSTLDYVQFNIPGTAPHTINFSQKTLLYPIQIDGTTQPANGYTGNLSKIKLQGINLFPGLTLKSKGSQIYGLTFSGCGLYLNSAVSGNGSSYIGSPGKSNVFLNSIVDIRTSDCIVQNNFVGTDQNYSAGYKGSIGVTSTKNASILNNIFYYDPSWASIDLIYDTNTVIRGNKIGIDATGTTLLNGPKGRGISCQWSVNLTIGGEQTSEGNIIAGYLNGIEISAVKDASIKGNKIGTDQTGTQSLGGDKAIYIGGGSNITIGGSNVASGNIIAGNSIPYTGVVDRANIFVTQSKKIFIYNNKIGTASDGITALGYTNYNIFFEYWNDSSEVGKTNGYGNIIANGVHGVVVGGSVRVSIRGNSIFNNTNNGIYVASPDFYIPNPNEGILPPIVTELSGTKVAGTSIPNAKIDLYYSIASSLYQGKTYIATVTANTSGNWTYNGTIATPCLVTSTATDQKGNTSNFSRGIGGIVNPFIDLCQGSSITLNALGATQYSWSPVTGLNNPAIANPVASPINHTTYTLTTYNSVNSCSGEFTVTIQVKFPPNVNLPPHTTLCYGDSILLNAGSADITAYNWSTGQTTQQIKVGGIPQKYKVTVTGSNGCFASDSVSIQVQEPIALTGKDTSICSNNTLLLGDNVIPTYQYSWTPITGLDNPSIARPTATITSDIKYYLTVLTPLGCQANDSVTIDMNELPIANAGPNQEICLGSNVVLGSTSVADITYKWAGSPSLSATDIAMPVASPITNAYYILEVEDANGCTNTDDVYVTVNSCTGISSKAVKELFHVYPNPTSENLYIEIIEQQEIDYELSDSKGMILLKGSNNSNVILDLTEIPSGIYYLLIKSDGKFSSTKIVKN
jgi:hypothetical protein